jgi:hypothetical protein
MASNPVSYACWGLPAKAFSLGFTLLALAGLAGRDTGWRRWLSIAAAGLATGLNVSEGGDIGAILSLYVAVFLVWQCWTESIETPRKLWNAAMRLTAVVVFAGWIAAHAIHALVSTQIVAVSGMDQKRETEAQRWQFATAISLPPVESLRIVVPGLFGYRMDSPDGGAYWGAVGFDGTSKGRWSGAGEYAGILVVLVASYAAATSMRKKQSTYSKQERQMVWFWTAVAAGSLALSWGHFAPFYRIFFAIPYLSTIRIPSKFLHVMHLALWVLFAYGLEAIARGTLASGRDRMGSWKEQFAAWRKHAAAAEVNWVFGALAVFAVALIGVLQFAGNATELKSHLQGIEFQMGPPATAEFSIGEAWKALGFFAVSLGLVAGMITGFFNGTRARIGWMLLGTVLVVDLYRANTPWVKYYDWVTRYQSNPVLDLLKDKPWEQRVTAFLDPHRQGPLVGGDAALSWTYLQKEWLENQFQYFNIQSLDISQMPRVATDQHPVHSWIQGSGRPTQRHGGPRPEAHPPEDALRSRTQAGSHSPQRLDRHRRRGAIAHRHPFRDRTVCRAGIHRHPAPREVLYRLASRPQRCANTPAASRARLGPGPASPPFREDRRDPAVTLVRHIRSLHHSIRAQAHHGENPLRRARHPVAQRPLAPRLESDRGRPIRAAAAGQLPHAGRFGRRRRTHRRIPL